LTLKVIFLPGRSVLSLFPSLQLPYLDNLIVLLPQEVWKDKIFWSEKGFQSYNQIFASIPGWETVIPVGTGTGDSQICVSFSLLGGPIECFQGKIAWKNIKFYPYSESYPYHYIATSHV
jgi:hypothetical protein